MLSLIARGAKNVYLSPQLLGGVNLRYQCFSVVSVPRPRRRVQSKTQSSSPSVKAASPSSSLLSTDGNATNQVTGFTNTREGDWVCPSCGVLSFSWRHECYNCNTLRPNSEFSKALVERKTRSILDPKRTRGGKLTARQNLKEAGVVLKDMLQLSQKSKDYSVVVSLADKHLASKKELKSSVVATMMRVYGKSGDVDKAIDLFRQIGTNPHIRNRPTQYHYSAVITACADNGKWEDALSILDDMRDMKSSEDKNVKHRKPPNLVIYSAVMNACGRAGRYDKALYVFDTLLTERHQGNGPPKDTILFNQALNACRQTGRFKRAYELYAEMYTHKIKRDQVTYGTMLSICDEAGDWVLANEILKDIKYRKAVDFNVQMYSSAIGAFTKGGELSKAMDLFNDAKQQKNLILDAPLYSKALFALATLSKEAAEAISAGESKVTTNSTRDDSASKSESKVLPIPNTSYGHQALQLLSEMTTRNLRISAYPVVQTIEALDAAGMYSEAMALYMRGEKNKVFPPSVMDVKDKHRRVDLRQSSAAMCRAKVWAVLAALREKGEAKHDLLLVLGNNNKHLLDFVINSLKDNAHSISSGSNLTDVDSSAGNAVSGGVKGAEKRVRQQGKRHSNPVRSVVLQEGTVLRLPRAALTGWIAKSAAA